MRKFLLIIAALGAFVAGINILLGDAIFGAIVSIGALIAFTTGSKIPKKAKSARKSELTYSGSINYDAQNLKSPNKKGPPSAIKYP